MATACAVRASTGALKPCRSKRRGSAHEGERCASSAWRPRPRSRGASTRRRMHGARPMPRGFRGRPGIGARDNTRGGLGHRHPTLAHGALAQHVDHVVHARRAALGDLGRQEQRRVDGALRIDLPPADVVLELEHDGLVGRDEPARPSAPGVTALKTSAAIGSGVALPLCMVPATLPSWASCEGPCCHCHRRTAGWAPCRQCSCRVGPKGAGSACA